MDGENFDAVSALEGMMDDNGFLPTDADYTAPEEDRSEEVTNEDPEVTEDADPEDEPEGDESDEDEESEEESEEEESPNTAIDDETLVDIQIGDDLYEVNFAELRAGYLRNEELVARTTALEAEHSAKVLELEQKEAALQEELMAVTVMLAGDLTRYDQINWKQLKEQDPETYAKARLEAMEAKERVDQVNARRQQIAQMHTQAQALRHQAYLESQYQAVLKALPEFAEKSFRDKLVEYGKTVGFSKEDIEGIADARQLIILNNARQHAEAVVRRKDAAEKLAKADLPPVKKPGAAKPADSGKRKVVAQASARMRSEKSVDAAAAYLMTLDL